MITVVEKLLEEVEILHVLVALTLDFRINRRQENCLVNTCIIWAQTGKL